MKKRILWLLTGPIEKPRTGGEVFTRCVMDYSRRRGWQVDLLTLADAPRWVRRNYLCANLWFFLRIALRRRSGSLIVEDSYVHPWLFLTNWCLRVLCGFRIAIFNQSFYFYRQVSRTTNAVDRFVTKLCFIPANLIITNSQWMKEETTRLGVPRARIDYVRPGCDLPRLPAPLPKKSSDTMRIVCLSNYRLQKGQHVLLDALHNLVQNHRKDTDSFEVICAGSSDGFEDYFKRLQEKANNYSLSHVLELRGPITQAELPDFLAISDIFILPTLNEGYGMVVAEAMCFGLPVICTDLPVLRELVEDGVNGILVPPQDPKALTDAITTLLKDPDLHHKMGEASLRKAQDRELVPTWEDTCKKFERVLREQL